MDDPRPWSPCGFGTDGLIELPNIHDHFVYALTAHLEQRRLLLHTRDEHGPGSHALIDLQFNGLIAHHFDIVADPSILLDIEQVTPARIIQQWADLFDKFKNHGWPPIEYHDHSDLATKLASCGVHGYCVMGSCGLDGFVLAASIEYRRLPLARPDSKPISPQVSETMTMPEHESASLTNPG